MTHMELVAKIESVRPGAIWTLTDADYDKLVWQDPIQTKPTPEELGI